MTIYEALMESHQKQRRLADLLIKTEGDSEGRAELFDRLRHELQHHAASEERWFYKALMDFDETQHMARHSVAEHHELDEMIDELEQTDRSSPGWIAQARHLRDRVHHHLDEEEDEVFGAARKVLDASKAETLGRSYRKEMQARAEGKVETLSSADV
jgi:hemerythrin-like domain-containing protein